MSTSTSYLTQMAHQASPRMSPASLHRRSLGGGKIAGIVVAALAIILSLIALLLVRFLRSYTRQQERQQEENEFWHCRGRPEDLERAPAQGQVTESFDMVPQQSHVPSPVTRSAIGSTRTVRTMTAHSDSGYGPSPVSTIKSMHATSHSMSSVRPTLVDLSLQRFMSRMSRLVSGEVSDVQAERSTPSSSPTTDEQGAACRSLAKTPSPRKTPSLPFVVPSATQNTKGLIFLPVSAASPDGKSPHSPLHSFPCSANTPKLVHSRPPPTTSHQ